MQMPLTMKVPKSDPKIDIFYIFESGSHPTPQTHGFCSLNVCDGVSGQLRYTSSFRESRDVTQAQ